MKTKAQIIAMDIKNDQDKVRFSETEWRNRLSDEQYHVLREAGTEPAYTGRYWNEKAKGKYRCAGCGEHLFASSEKYESGSGWPSFTAPVKQQAISEHADTNFGMCRIEIRCARCESHLGHIFPDGPGPGGLRYCVNSASLHFNLEK